MRIARAVVGAAVAGATLCGCHRAGARTYRFRCADGYAIGAQFVGDSVRLHLPDTSLTMPRLLSADGARYGSGALIFWEKGTTAFMQRGGSITHKDCTRRSGD